MKQEPVGAILQRDNKTYAIVPRTPVGLVTPAHLEKIAAVARKFNIPVVKITTGQRIALVGIERGEVDQVWQELGMDVGKTTEHCLHYVQACVGNDYCMYGKQDSIGLGMRIESSFSGMELPAKVKIGVSGCTLCCAESYVRDIGVFGKRSGWNLVVGGSSARRARVADLVGEGLDVEALVASIQRILECYRDHGNESERMARFIERVGIEVVKEALA